jgi:hypothetical protein
MLSLLGVFGTNEDGKVHEGTREVNRATSDSTIYVCYTLIVCFIEFLFFFVNRVSNETSIDLLTTKILMNILDVSNLRTSCITLNNLAGERRVEERSQLGLELVGCWIIGGGFVGSV